MPVALSLKGCNCCVSLAVASAVLLLSAGAPQSEPWHLAGWPSRAVVEIPKPLADTGVDTAVVEVPSCGRAQPDGHRPRVVAGTGQPVTLQLFIHDSGP